MTEYWKSVGNYYCDYCKTFVRNDAFSRRQHEASPRHENALRRQVKNIHKRSEQEARELAQANRELARIGGKVALPSKPASVPVKPAKTEVKPQKIKIQRKDKMEKTLDDSSVYVAAMERYAAAKDEPESVVEQVDALAAAAHQATLAEHAILGAWSSVAPESGNNVSGDINEQASADLDVVKTENSDSKVEEGTQLLPLADAATTTTKTIKRRRDGADEDLIGFRVQKKKEVPDVNEFNHGGAIPVVAFKKKKKIAR